MFLLNLSSLRFVVPPHRVCVSLLGLSPQQAGPELAEGEEDRARTTGKGKGKGR